MLIPMKIKRNLAHYDGKFIKIKGKEYYCKNAMDPGDQLFANAIAEKLGIICAKDYIIEVDGDYYYLSYSFNNDGIFKDGNRLGIKSNGLYDIWMFFEKNYPKDSEKLTYQLIRVYLFDIFMMNCDRNLGNLGILIRDGVADLCILDNEYVFSDFGAILLPKLFFDDRLKSYKCADSLDNRLPICVLKNIESLEYFLATSAQEFYDIVLEFYNTLTPDFILLEMKKLNKMGFTLENQEHSLILYKKYHELIGNLLLERGILDGKRLS